jgi:hypothetical protein
VSRWSRHSRRTRWCTRKSTASAAAVIGGRSGSVLQPDCDAPRSGSVWGSQSG